jgi:hypothetical protein
LLPGRVITMKDYYQSPNQARAIERWENEGGKVSVHATTPSNSQVDFTINEKRLDGERTIERNKRRWTKDSRILPVWRFAS